MSESQDETVNGWTPPMIYDVYYDKTRIATQEDVDRLVGISREYNRILREMRGRVDFADMQNKNGWKG